MRVRGVGLRKKRMRLGKPRRTGGLKARASVGLVIGGLLRAIVRKVTTGWRLGRSVNWCRGRVNHKSVGCLQYRWQEASVETRAGVITALCSRGILRTRL
jgi:hypothetical protein